ncbi:MAG TPA: PEP-CTERM sorting domain-containing protein [Rhodanobacteraceae bacterium]
MLQDTCLIGAVAGQGHRYITQQKGSSIMKHYLVLALAALVFAFAAPSAFATRVIFDPPAAETPVCAPGASCNVTNINALGGSTPVSFLPCSQLPSGVNTQGSSYCLWLNNVSGQAGSTFNFVFTVPNGGSSSSGFECSSVVPAPAVVTNNCPPASPAAGSLLSVSFFVQPPLPTNTDFYLFTDFTNSPGTANVTVSVPEPGELGLFGLGLLALGLGVAWRRRTSQDHVGA